MPEPLRNAMPFAGPPCSWCQVPTGAAGRGDRSRTGRGPPACLLAERQSDRQKQPGRPLFHQMRDSGVTCSFNKGLLSACFAADSLLGAGHSRAMTGLLCSNGADVRGSRRQTLNHQTLLLACARAEHTGRTAGSPERQTWRWRGAGRGGQPHLLRGNLRWVSALPAASGCLSGDRRWVKTPLCDRATGLGRRRRCLGSSRLNQAVLRTLAGRPVEVPCFRPL